MAALDVLAVDYTDYTEREFVSLQNTELTLGTVAAPLIDIGYSVDSDTNAGVVAVRYLP